MFFVEAKRRLDAAGHTVTVAEGVPGLFNVEGLARDVTSGQLLQLAAEHGAHIFPSRNYMLQTLS